MTTRQSSALRLTRPDRHRLDARGRAAFAGFSLRLLARTPSTQDVVRTAARAGSDEGFCCVAAEQSAGRGRQDRHWMAPPGTSLLASILLRPAAATTAGVTLAAGIAVAEALATCSGVKAQLKWPNDVVVDGAKLAGILAEVTPVPNDPPVVILGFGVNLTVDTFPHGAHGTSVHRLVPAGAPSWDVLLANVLAELSVWLLRLREAGLESVLPAWRARAVGLGSGVTVTTPVGRITGVAVDIDSDGALLLATADGTVRLLAGDVHIGVSPADHPPSTAIKLS